MGRRKNPETKEEIQAELIYAKEQILKLKNQEKMYANAYKNEERRQRTRRLCTEAGILERYVPELKELMEKDQSPALSDLMLQYLEIERQRVKKYSGMFQLKHYAEMTTEVMETLDKLSGDGIHTLADLEAALSDVKGKSDTVRQSLLKKEKRMKELQKLFERGEQYQENDLVHRELVGIKWKKQKDAYESEHSAELTLWNTANQFLHAKGISPADLPEKIRGWQAELNNLSEAHDLEYSDLKYYREKVKELDKIHRQVAKALAPEPEQLGKKNQNVEL